jgi:hypothetical protein
MKTAGYSSFLVLSAISPELQDNNRTVQMNNENRIFVVNFDEAFNLVLPEQTPNNKQIQLITHGNLNATVRVFPFGTSQVDIDAQTGMIAELLSIQIGDGTFFQPQTFTFQFLYGVTYVTKQIGSSDVVETEVSFTKEQIRAMGTAPLELLPAPGVGMYNSIDSIIQEYKHVGTAYTAATASTVDLKIGSIAVCQNPISQLTSSVSSVVFSQLGNTDTLLNTALTATTDDASDLTAGTGTLKFIISYKIRTVA